MTRDGEGMQHKEAELRSQGWVGAKELAEAGYDWSGGNTPGTRIERLEQVFREFQDDLIERLSFALMRQDPELPKRKAEEYGSLVDGVIIEAVGRLVDQVGEKSYASPVGLRLMELAGILSQRERAEDLAPSRERFVKSKPKSIAPESSDILDRKGRSIE